MESTGRGVGRSCHTHQERRLPIVVGEILEEREAKEGDVKRTRS